MNSKKREYLERRCKTNLWKGKIDQLNSNEEDRYHDCWNKNNNCNPENEAELRDSGKIDPKECTGLNYIFLCNKRIMHVCSMNECDLWTKTGTCPISGIVHGRVLKTGKDRSGHYLRGDPFSKKENMRRSAHSSVRHGDYGINNREKRILVVSDENIENAKKKQDIQIKRRKLMSSGNIFRKSGSSIVNVEKASAKIEVKPKTESTELCAIYNQLSDVRVIQQFANDNENDNSKERSKPTHETIAVVKQHTSKKGNNGHRTISTAMRTRFRKTVESIIARLFFSSTRKTLNDKAKADAMIDWGKKYRQYKKDLIEQGRDQTYIEKYEIALNTQANPPFSILSNKGVFVKKYFAVVQHVWGIVCKYGTGSFCNSGIRVCVQITIGTLYSMRNSGIMVNGVNYLPQNLELLDLPPLPMLRYFRQPNIDSNISYNRSFTVGANAILKAYQNAVDIGTSISDLVLNSNIIAPETTRTAGKRVEKKLIKVISRPAKALACKWEGAFQHLEMDDIYDQIIRDKAHLKRGDQKLCFENLTKMNEENGKRMEDVITHAIQLFPSIEKSDVRFYVVMNKAWKNREQWDQCVKELKKKTEAVTIKKYL